MTDEHIPTPMLARDWYINVITSSFLEADSLGHLLTLPGRKPILVVPTDNTEAAIAHWTAVLNVQLKIVMNEQERPS